MSSIEERRAAFHSFLRNPQIHGVWCLRAYFGHEKRAKLESLLNIDRQPNRTLRRYAETESSPLILLRLFAYLRTILPRKDRDQLRPLFSSSQDFRSSRLQYRYSASSRRLYYLFEETAREPNQLGKEKRQKLLQAHKIFAGQFLECVSTQVPQNPTKLDFSDRKNAVYFQVTEDPSGAIRIYTPHKETIQTIQQLLESLPDARPEFEVTRQFSPEESLMEMYIPMLLSLPIESVLWDKRTIQNTLQALDDLREERFVHAIRAIGIAIEELLVEIYETYLREKAPEVPLGSLLNEFSNRIQEILQGSKKKQEINIGNLRKELGKIIEAEKKKVAPSQELIAFLESTQRSIVPFLEDLKGAVFKLNESTEELISERNRAQRAPVFPSYVYRCLSGLILLRNRVSHREEKSGSTSLIGYIEASTALRAFIVLATWWQHERTKIDYGVDKKEALQQTVERSRIET